MSIRSILRAAVIASALLTLLVPVRADASNAPESGRTERAERPDARGWPYIRDTNRFQVVCCRTFSEWFTADYCPNRFQLIQVARLGISDARGDWVTVHWIKLRSDGNHWNKLTHLLLKGSDGGVYGYTLGPRYKRNSDVYKRIRAFPNPTEVKYNDDAITLDLSGKYAPGKNVPYPCRRYGDANKIEIRR
jgi:hypothetical protein